MRHRDWKRGFKREGICVVKVWGVGSGWRVAWDTTSVVFFFFFFVAFLQACSHGAGGFSML